MPPRRTQGFWTDVLRASGRGNLGCDYQPIIKRTSMAIWKLAGDLSGLSELFTAMRRPGGHDVALAARDGLDTTGDLFIAS